MTRLVSIFALCLASLSAQSANVYFRASAPDGGTGADWAHAYNGWSTVPIPRGDMAYMAGGNYAGKVLNTPLSGSTYIFIRKATVSDHGTSVGWLDSYEGQVHTGQLDLRVSYIDIDGVTGNAYNSRGILVGGNTFILDDGQVRIYNGFFSDHLRLRSVEISCGSPGVNSQSKAFYSSATAYTDHYFTNCFIHDSGQTWITESTGNGLFVDNCYFTRVGTAGGVFHSAGIVFSGNSNVTIRNSMLGNVLNSGTTYIEPQQVGGNGLLCYGNVFFGSDPAESAVKGIYAVTASDTFQNAYFFNNTIYGLHGQFPGINGGNVAGSSSFAYNNVWQNCLFPPNFAFCDQATNILNTPFAVNFIDPVNGDFRLAAQTPTLGMTLPSPYNLDPIKVTRVPGSWSLGAYQYTGSTPPPVPGNVTIAQSNISVLESSPFVAITVNRINGSDGIATATLVTSNGTATAGHDYAATTNTLVWADGEVGARTASVQLINSGDTSITDRTLFVSLTSSTGTTIVPPSASTVTIIMNRPIPPPPPMTNGGTIGFTSTSFPTTETSGSVVVSVARTGGTNFVADVPYMTFNGSAVDGFDYTGASGTVHWNANENGIKVITPFTILNSGSFGPPRNFFVGLGSVSGILVAPQRTAVSITMSVPISIGTKITIGNTTISATTIGGK